MKRLAVIIICSAVLTILALAAPKLLAAEFPKQQVKYVCETAGFYITKSLEECLIEQYGWYSEIAQMGLTDKEYQNALWYGQRYGYMGEVQGIDFKPVLERAKYLEKQ